LNKMFKTIFFWSITSAVLSSIACLIYDRIYFFALDADFSKLINIGSLIGINLLGCLFAGVGYWLAKKWLGIKGELIFNLLFSILSFASIIFPISVSLPIQIKHPELFPGLTVPMHFFPALAWFTVRPLFIKDGQNRLKEKT
jgi:hypothetical protein